MSADYKFTVFNSLGGKSLKGKGDRRNKIHSCEGSIVSSEGRGEHFLGVLSELGQSRDRDTHSSTMSSEHIAGEHKHL